MAHFQSVPAFGVGVATASVAGAALCLQLPSLPPGAWLVAAVGMGAWLWRRRDPWRLAGALLAGFGWCGLNAAAALALQWPVARDRTDHDIVGRVVELPVYEARRTSFLFRVDDKPGLEPELRGRLLRLSWFDGFDGRTDVRRLEIDPGSHWRLRVRVSAPRGLRNAGAQDSERHALARRLAATGHVRDPDGAARLSPAAGIDAWRDKVSRSIERGVASGSARFVRALALGDTRGLDDADWETLRATGLTHLIAISGFHVGLVAGAFGLLAALAWRAWPRLAHGLPRPQAVAIATLAGAAGYAAVAGFGLPTLRTALMVAVVLVARLWRRPLPVSQALAIAALAITWFDPLALLAAGFWLSFAGVAWLAWCLPDARGGRHAGTEFVSAQVVATVGLLPLTVLLFGQASAAGPLANLVAIPWWSLVVVPLSLLGTAAEAFHPGWGDGAWRLAAACFDLAWPWFQTLGRQAWGLWWLPEAPRGSFALAVVGAFWCLLPHGVPGKPLALVLWLPLLWPDRGLPDAGGVDLVVLDVGQGLSVLARTRSHAVLYDMGPAAAEGFDAGERTVVPALHALGVRRLDVAVVSHGDADHAGGYPAVRRRYRPAVALAPEGAGVDGTASCRAGHRWHRDGVRFEFLHPPRHFPYLRNEASCILRIESAHGAILLTGDAGEVIERGLVARQAPALRAGVVVVPHHGSRHSSSTGLVDATGASFALVSAGYRNRFGHPHPDAVTRWQAGGAQVLSTADAGALRIRIGVTGISASGERARRPRLWDAARRQAHGDPCAGAPGPGGCVGGLSYRPDQ